MELDDFNESLNNKVFKGLLHFIKLPSNNFIDYYKKQEDYLDVGESRQWIVNIIHKFLMNEQESWHLWIYISISEVADYGKEVRSYMNKVDESLSNYENTWARYNIGKPYYTPFKNIEHCTVGFYVRRKRKHA